MDIQPIKKAIPLIFPDFLPDQVNDEDPRVPADSGSLEKDNH